LTLDLESEVVLLTGEHYPLYLNENFAHLVKYVCALWSGPFSKFLSNLWINKKRWQWKSQKGVSALSVWCCELLCSRAMIKESNTFIYSRHECVSSRKLFNLKKNFEQKAVFRVRLRSHIIFCFCHFPADMNLNTTRMNWSFCTIQLRIFSPDLKIQILIWEVHSNSKQMKFTKVLKLLKLFWRTVAKKP
jgi:hypothetical protein